MLIGRALIDGKSVDVRWSPEGPVPISFPDDGDATGGRPRDVAAPRPDAEIAVVIGRDCTALTAATADRFVRGVTAVNDLSSPDRAAIDVRTFESKSGVGYTPLGPWIDTRADTDHVALRLEIDGAVAAQTDAGALPVSIRECLAYVTSWTTLGAGDVVRTGAPFSAAPIEPGHRVDVIVGDVRLTTPTS